MFIQRRGLAALGMAGVEPPGAIAGAAGRAVRGTGARALGTKLPIILVEGATIDADTSFACDLIGAAAVDLGNVVGNRLATRADSDGPGLDGPVVGPLFVFSRRGRPQGRVERILRSGGLVFRAD